MKLYLLLIQIGMATYAFGQNPNYDSELAKKLNGDNYGMKSYTFVLLSTGEAKINDKNVVDSLFRGHMENIHTMVQNEKLIIAGPFMKNEKGFRGIFILNTTDKAEIDILMRQDPAINNGLLSAETFTWYGSAALPTYLPFSDKIWKEKP